MADPVVDPGFTSTADCPHGAYELRRRTYANGVVHFVYQCIFCGASGRSIKKDLAIGQLNGASAPTFDEALPESFWQRRRELRDAEWEADRRSRQDEYDAYLLSPGWRRKRERRLAMDRWQCQARLDGCTERATEVHHLTYQHRGDEPLFDLVSVCESCHRRISAMDGQCRGAN
jgi:hypothetical protein